MRVELDHRRVGGPQGWRDGIEPVPLENERHRVVRVAEEADGTFRGLERAQRVRGVEHVHVFVDRRPMTDLRHLVDEDGAGAQIRNATAVLGCERLECPERGHRGHFIEVMGRFKTGGDLVVIAANRDIRVHGEHAIDDLIGARPIADEVAQDDQALVRLSRHGGYHGLERFDIGVDVTEDEETHRPGTCLN